MMLSIRCAVLGAIATVLACGDGGSNFSNSSPKDPCADNSCTKTSAVAAFGMRKIRRLSRREYNNVVRDLLGDTSQPAQRFVVDTYQNGYDNGSAGLAVQSEQVVGFQQAAEALAATTVENGQDRLLGGCDPATQGEAACEDAFLQYFAPRAYRRPLTTSEIARLREIWALGAAVGGFKTGIQTALELILQSPQFLYREELGADDAPVVAEGGLRLTAHEIASQLSFLLTGSVPDDDLRKAVDEGRFTSTDDYRRETARLLATPAAKDTMRAFLHQWMATYRLGDLTKDPEFYPSFNGAMAQSMATELDQFYDAVVWGERGSLRELFTSNESFVDANLAGLYGVAADGPGFRPVTLDPDLRKGILARAGYLAVHASGDSSGPISRGVFLLQAMLCMPPPAPPANIPAAAPPGEAAKQNMTTRERFADHVAKPGCPSCHAMIDGIGFGFEAFDSIGAHRTTENGKPVDSHGTVLGTGEIDGDYDGVGELATRMAGSRRLADCYARQAYRFAMGDVEPRAPDSIDWLKAEFTSDARLTDVLMTIVTSPVFVTRKPEP